MKIISTPQGIVDRKRPGQGLKDLQRAGFGEVLLDFTLVCNANAVEQGDGNLERQELQIWEKPKLLREQMRLFLEKSRELGLSFSIGRAPYLSSNSRHTDYHAKLAALAEESIRLCGEAGCRYLIVYPLVAGVAESDMRRVNVDFYLSLAKQAKESAVSVLLENRCRNRNGHFVRTACTDERELLCWIEELNQRAVALYGAFSADDRDYFGSCMNVGVCNLCGQNMHDFAATLSGNLKAVVLRDCDGEKDNSLLPFTCVNAGTSRTDWLNVIRGLRTISFEGELLLDFSDTAAAFSPMLKPELLRLARAIAEYFQWQLSMEIQLQKYASRVLFGAGNMCRNYMKAYGTQYPPLYTCDNNSALWGQQLAGLEIKNPEELKKLPADVAIFICNIYYREIEEQLRKMGLKNPILFFNDEYMPSFPFDRLET